MWRRFDLPRYSVTSSVSGLNLQRGMSIISFMEQVAPAEIDAAIVRRINREAGYVVLSTYGVFLAGLALAFGAGHVLGSAACHALLAIIFPFAIFPAAFRSDGEDFLVTIVAYATWVATVSPIIVAAVVLGWRSTAWYGRPLVFILALKVSILGAFLSVAVLLVAPVFLGLLSELTAGAISTPAVGAFASMFPLGFLILASGVVLTMPSALICAYVYLRYVRPLLLRRGLVVDPDVIDAYAVERRRGAVQRADAAS